MIKRYNGSVNMLTGTRLLVDDVTSVNLYVKDSDFELPEKEQRLVPLYASRRVTDTTFFKPGLSDISQSLSGNWLPKYDSDINGNMPDYGLNIAYVRSPARDRVDIDMALQVVKDSVEKAQLSDKDSLQKAENAKNALQALGEIIAKNSKSEVQSDSSPSTSN